MIVNFEDGQPEKSRVLVGYRDNVDAIYEEVNKTSHFTMYRKTSILEATNIFLTFEELLEVTMDKGHYMVLNSERYCDVAIVDYAKIYHDIAKSFADPKATTLDVTALVGDNFVVDELTLYFSYYTEKMAAPKDKKVMDTLKIKVQDDGTIFLRRPKVVNQATPSKIKAKKESMLKSGKKYLVNAFLEMIRRESKLYSMDFGITTNDEYEHVEKLIQALVHDQVYRGLAKTAIASDLSDYAFINRGDKSPEVTKQLLPEVNAETKAWWVELLELDKEI